MWFCQKLSVSVGLKLYGGQTCHSNFWPDMYFTYTCQKMLIISYVFERYSSLYKRFKTTQPLPFQIPHNCAKIHTKQMRLPSYNRQVLSRFFCQSKRSNFLFGTFYLGHDVYLLEMVHVYLATVSALAGRCYSLG